MKNSSFEIFKTIYHNGSCPLLFGKSKLKSFKMPCEKFLFL